MPLVSDEEPKGPQPPQTPDLDLTPDTPAYTGTEVHPLDQWAFGTYLSQKIGSANWSQGMYVQAPDSILWLSQKREQRLSWAASEAAKALEEQYGEGVAPYLQSYMIPDQAAREAALASLNPQAQDWETRETVTGFGRYQHTATEYLNPATGEWQLEKPQTAEGAFEAVGGEDALAHRYAALTAFYASLNTRVEDGEIKRGFDYSQVLTPWEQQHVMAAVNVGLSNANVLERTTQVLTPWSAGQDFESQIISVEEGSGIYTIDQGWANAHPVKAMAMAEMLKDRGYANEVRIGEKGVLSTAGDLLGRPIDFVWGLPAVAYKETARAVGELGEDIAFSDEDRNEFAQTRDAIGAAIQSGAYEGQDLQEALREFERYNDFATAGNIYNPNESLKSDLHDAFMPEQAGTGLAVSSAEGIGLMEGDAAYSPWVTAVTLIHNFSTADPIGWAGWVRQGETLAKGERVFSGLTDVPRKGLTLDFLTKGASRASQASTSKTVATMLQKRGWISVAADLPNATAAQNEARFASLLSHARTAVAGRKGDVLVMTNEAGGREVVILGATPEQGLTLAKSWGQESFKTADGIIHTDRTITPWNWDVADAGKAASAADEGVSTLHAPGAAYHVRLEPTDPNLRIKIAPPKVSQNWIVQDAFTRNLRTVDDVAYGAEMANATDRVWEVVDTARKAGQLELDHLAKAGTLGATVPGRVAAATSRALGVLTDWSPGWDRSILEALARATSREDVHNVLLWGLLGGQQDIDRLAVVASRQAKIGGELAKVEASLAEVEQAKTRLGVLAEAHGINTLDPKHANAVAKLMREDVDFAKAMEDYRRLVSRANQWDLYRRRTDLIAERLHNQSLLDLDEITMPIRQVPPNEMLKELKRLAPGGKPTRLEALLGALAKYPGKYTSADLLRVARGKAPQTRAGARAARNERRATALEEQLIQDGTDPESALRQADKLRSELDKKAKEIFFRFDHVKQQLTGGQEILMPLAGSKIPPGKLADYITKSVKTIRDHARMFGLEDASVQRLLQQYASIRNREDWFQFVRDFFETIADESPILTANGRTALRQTHQELLAERGGGFLTHIDPSTGMATREDTLSRKVTDPLTGNTYDSGVPIFSSEFLGNFQLPPNEILMQYLTLSRRAQQSLKVNPRKSAQALGWAWQTSRDVFSAATYVWKTAILMGRMPFALLSRIQGEQGVRMAALDYSSYVNHPLQWFRSTRKGLAGEFLNWADSPAEALGVLTDTYNDVHSFGKSVKVWRRGRAVLSPEDGDRFWTALAAVFGRRYASPEVADYLRLNDPKEIVAWLKSPESGTLGDGILDNILANGADPEAAVGRALDELRELTGGRADLFQALKRGNVNTNAGRTLKLRKGRQQMDIDTLLERLQFNDAGAGTRTQQQLDDLNASIKAEGIKTPITVYFDPATGKVLVPEGRHRLTAGKAAGRTKAPVDVQFVDTATIEAQGSLRPPDNPARALPLEPEIVHVNTQEMARYLKAEAEAGRFKPPQYISAKASEYVFESKANLAGGFRDFMFRNFYTRPDLALSRGPMFRQAAAREYGRLTSLGMDPGRAKQAAKAYAAQHVADYMYDLANRTSAQYFWRNVLPFMPAWEELGNTWLRRLPMHAGGGGVAGWALGASLYAHRADVFVNYLEDTGLVHYQDGRLFFSIPGVDQIYQWWTGNDKAHLKFDAKSLIGIFPIPDVTADSPLGFIASLLPGLGPIPSGALNILARNTAVGADIANVVMRYGNDPEFGPSSINKIFHAMGFNPPWEYLTQDVQDLQERLAINDGIRAAYGTMGPYPVRGDFKSEKAWNQAVADWKEELIRRGESMASKSYLLRGVASMFLPLTPTVTDEYKEELSGIWNLINNFEEGTGKTGGSALLDEFKRRHPDATWYTNSSSINSSKDTNYEDYDNFISDYRKGLVHVLNAKEFVEWNIGLNAYWSLLNTSRIATQGKSAPELLLSGFAQDQLKGDERAGFNMYLDSHAKFAELFEEWQGTWDDENGMSLTAAQKYVLDARTALEHLGKSFTVNGIRDINFQRVDGMLGELIRDVSFKTDDPEWQVVDKWYDQYGSQAYNAINALYDRAYDLPSAERGPIFEQLRQLKNGLKHVVIDGNRMPTPEEISWGNRSPEEQDVQRLEWLSHPIEWLSRFERRTAGMGGGPEVDKFIDQIADTQARIDQYVLENNLSTSSKLYTQMSDSADEYLHQYAVDHGLEKYWAFYQMPTFEKIYQTNSYNGNKSFEFIRNDVLGAMETFKRYDISITGTTSNAVSYQRYLFAKIEAARDADPEFDHLMDQLEVATAPSGSERAVGYDMYFKVFLGYYGPPRNLGIGA